MRLRLYVTFDHTHLIVNKKCKVSFASHESLVRTMSLWMKTSLCCVVVCGAISCLEMWYILSSQSKTSTPLPCDVKSALASGKVDRIVLVAKGRYRLMSFDPEAANATTLLVMSDTRDPHAPGYHRLSFLINSRYAALQQNTSLVFVHTPCLGGKSSTHRGFSPKDCVACFHKQHGGRAAPWCKLPDLSAVMETYPKVTRFVYIDSDAFVNTNASLPLAYFKSTLNMFYNYPWMYLSPACSGIMFWKAGPEALRILQEWWDTPGHNMIQHYTHHDYEQSAFRTSFWERNRAAIHVIREITMVSHERQMFRHIAGPGEYELRELFLQEAFENGNLTQKRNNIDLFLSTLGIIYT